MSIQPAWLVWTDLCSCLGHLQNGCEAMADSLLVFVPHEQTHRACSILKQIGMLSPDGTKARAVENIMKLIASSQSTAKVAPTAKDIVADLAMLVFRGKSQGHSHGFRGVEFRDRERERERISLVHSASIGL